jgi:hypothetical protein
MIGKILTGIGSAVFGVVGKIHDALGGDATPLNSANIQAAENDETNAIWYKTITFYVGGTLVVGTLLGLIICKVLPKMGKKKPARRRRRKTTTRRRTYRRKK